MSKSSSQGVKATEIHDDSSAPMLQIDGFGGAMFNGKKGGELLKLNLCQDIPIMSDPENGGAFHVQKKVIARLVMTPSVLKDFTLLLNDVLAHIEETEKSGD